MSETSIRELATIGFAFATTVFAGILAYKMKQLDKKQADALVKLEEVVDTQKVVATDVHDVKRKVCVNGMTGSLVEKPIDSQEKVEK